MKILTSVIIPCFNSARWLKEAIDSCLAQSYQEIEVIVIDDGSTDDSLDIIRGYDSRIIWESGPNRGGNHARNRGFALSKGEYIQYLDSDDYLMPEKIERQVEFLEKEEADVIYGDWQYLYHLKNGETVFGDIEDSRTGEDFLEMLLEDKKWIAPGAFLFTRAIVEKSGGWDESLKAGQDRDFLISVALANAKFTYQPGCYSVYRRYGKETVSTSNQRVWVENHFQLMKKAEEKLLEKNGFSVNYRRALAQSYFSKATSWCLYLNHTDYLSTLKKVQSLHDEFNPASSSIYGFLQRFFGFFITGIIFRFMKRVRYFWKLKPYEPLHINK